LMYVNWFGQRQAYALAHKWLAQTSRRRMAQANQPNQTQQNKHKDDK
jgi:hypothetical protein